MNDVPIVGEKKIEPKCPSCSAQPLQFGNLAVPNPNTGQVFMIFFCGACGVTINIQFLAQVGGIQPPNPSLKLPGVRQ
jgi:hypothetical protein